MASTKEQEKSTEKFTEKSAPATTRPEPKEEIVETDHTVTIDGKRISYRATTGTILLKEEEGKAQASVFFIAYTRSGVDDPGNRPVTFSFNGGPGSSSVWMHLGMLGPRRVLSGDVDSPLPPPHRLVENNESLLDVTDLVFIDPVSTGYSRPAPGEEAERFHGVDQDVESVGEFIRLYTTRYKRWASPKFLIGESYGTTRAAGLAGYLQDKHGMYLNGLMLISSILNFQTARFTTGNDLPYILFLPTYTATAWYHKRLDDDLQADLQATLRQVEEFAEGEYAAALMLGDKLPAERRAALVQTLARFTGLRAAYIEQTNLRIDIHRFCKELLRDRRLTVGRIDSRATGRDRDAAGEHMEFDPSISATMGSYTGAMNHYVRNDLRFTSDLPYNILTPLYEKWDYGKYANQFLDVAETLRAAMSKNPFLQVYVANGYFDLATPYFATEYTIHHLGLETDLQQNVRMGYFDAGHMMYIHAPSLVAIKTELADFVRTAAPAQNPEAA